MENLEDKFRSLELDDEIQKLKQERQNPSHQTSSQNNFRSRQQIHEKRTRLYAILGLKNDASHQEIKQAYRNFVKKFHPDLFCHNPQLQQKAQEVLMKINKIYEELF